MHCWRAFRRLVIRIGVQRLGIEQKFNDFGFINRDLSRRLDDVSNFLARRNLGLAAQIATFANEIVFRVSHLQVTIVETPMTANFLIEWFGPRREHDGLAALIFGHVFGVSHAMPKLFGYERQKRVE